MRKTQETLFPLDDLFICRGSAQSVVMRSYFYANVTYFALHFLYCTCHRRHTDKLHFPYQEFVRNVWGFFSAFNHGEMFCSVLAAV